jgi:hypothetical protein
VFLAHALPVLLAFGPLDGSAAGQTRRCVRSLKDRAEATCDDIELLVDLGLLACVPRANGQRGTASPARAVSCRTVVTLTPAGKTLVADLEHARELWLPGPRAGRGTSKATTVPRWERRVFNGKFQGELSYEGVVIAAYSRAAPVQHCILDAFELEKWRRRIDDPLPPHSEILPDVHLRDTIRSLNEKLAPPLIRFGADGTGRGVCWWPTGMKPKQSRRRK